MTAETFPSSEPSAERQALDAWLNPFVRTGERRIMGPAACEIPTDLGRSAIAGFEEVSDDPNAPLKPNCRYTRYVGDDSGWSLENFSTDSEGNIIESSRSIDGISISSGGDIVVTKE